VSEQLSDTLPAWAEIEQKGFVRFRQGLENVLDIDTYSRIADLKASNNFPTGVDIDILKAALLMLFDFMAAFPSVSHEFLFISLKAAGVPKWMRRFFRALYKDNDVYYSIDGVRYYFLTVLAGVLQGCPSSGNLFVVVLNPFIILLKRATSIGGQVRAFADDIAAVIEGLRQLYRISQIFKLAEKTANLKLKAAKCVLIPLGLPCDERVKALVKQYVEQHVPEWTGVEIGTQGKYLGFRVGPAAGAKVWSAAQGKWISRSLAIAAAKVAPSLGVAAYNQRSLPCLGYIAQIVPPTKAMLRLEKSLNQKVFHVLNNTFPKSFLYRGKSFGMPQFDSLKVLSWSARFRTATKTLRNVSRNLADWTAAVQADGSLGMTAGLRDRLPHWDSCPLILLVDEARKGFETQFPGLASEVKAGLTKDDRSTKRLGPQKLAAQHILPRLYPLSIAEECSRRLALWLPDDHPAKKQNLTTRVSGSIGLMRGLPKMVVINILKIWCNGLVTYYRLHKPRRPCILCKDPESTDRLSHIIDCEAFWSALAVVRRSNVCRCRMKHLAVNPPQENLLNLHILADVYQNISASSGPISDHIRVASRRLRMLME